MMPNINLNILSVKSQFKIKKNGGFQIKRKIAQVGASDKSIVHKNCEIILFFFQIAEQHKMVQTFEYEHQLEWHAAETKEGEVIKGAPVQWHSTSLNPLLTIASK